MANNLSPHLIRMTAEAGRAACERKARAESERRKAYKSEAQITAEKYGVSLEQAHYLCERGEDAKFSDGGVARRYGKRR